MMRFVGAAVAAMVLAGSASAANLVTNGGFEQVAPGAPVQGFQVGGNHNIGQAVIGWTSQPGSNTNSNNAFNVLFNSATATTVSPDTQYTAFETQTLSSANYGGPSPDGGNFMALDGDTQANGYFDQTINGLTIGKNYTLKFYWAATQFQNRVGATTERLDYSFGNQSFSTATVGGATHYWVGWFTETRVFTATSSSQLLRFLSVGTPDGLPPVALLDGVSLTANVPEPATWAMLIAGFGLVGTAARRRRLVVAA